MSNNYDSLLNKDNNNIEPFDKIEIILITNFYNLYSIKK